ncbi:MAG: NADP(H)-dependent aldo-keto reductase [Saprospiraceae bacterium]|jgi:aryl-alcohol dehydrogenase-like predicted oxidoreductase|nr:NADP(H)-dependent aldo-keto reductase [Saprospiraceae bacterium]
MRYRKLGNTEIEVSVICMGTMTFGQQNTEAEGHEQIDYALANGINFVDTAEMYSVPGRPETQGSTERIIGTWLAKTGKRKDIVLASKVTGPSPGLKYISPNLGFSKARILEAFEGSCKRLQTDYIDIYQMHWPERRTNFFGVLGYTQHDDQWEDNFMESITTMDQLVKEGKIRHWGLSNETPWGVMRSFNVSDGHQLPRPVSIQNPYNLLNRSFEVGLSEISIRDHISLLAYSPMGFGLLSGKFHDKADTANDRINQFKNLSRYNSTQSWEATERYIKIAREAGLTPAVMALAFVNDRPFVTSNIIGATSMLQLKENISSIDVTLSKDVLDAIDLVHKDISNPAP